MAVIIFYRSTRFMKNYLDFVKKNLELLAAQNNDPEVKERDYVVMLSILPLKALYSFKKRKLKGNY